MGEYKIKANKKQLLSFGINYDITGLIGKVKHKYPTWYAIEIIHVYKTGTFTNIFYIPKTFLKRVKNKS